MYPKNKIISTYLQNLVVIVDEAVNFQLPKAKFRLDTYTKMEVETTKLHGDELAIVEINFLLKLSF